MKGKCDLRKDWTSNININSTPKCYKTCPKFPHFRQCFWNNYSCVRQSNTH